VRKRTGDDEMYRFRQEPRSVSGNQEELQMQCNSRVLFISIRTPTGSFYSSIQHCESVHVTTTFYSVSFFLFGTSLLWVYNAARPRDSKGSSKAINPDTMKSAPAMKMGTELVRSA
jgi:hypothetical protein